MDLRKLAYDLITNIEKVLDDHGIEVSLHDDLYYEVEDAIVETLEKCELPKKEIKLDPSRPLGWESYDDGWRGIVVQTAPGRFQLISINSFNRWSDQLMKLEDLIERYEDEGTFHEFDSKERLIQWARG